MQLITFIKIGFFCHMSLDEKWDTDLYAGKHGNTEQFGNELLHLTDMHSKTDKIWIRSLKIKMNRFSDKIENFSRLFVSKYPEET